MRLAQAIGFVLLIIMAAGIPGPSVGASQQGTTSTRATPAADPGSAPALPSAAGISATEQALADKYVPTVMLRTQPEACSPVGERYVPIAVDIALNDPQVTLRRRRQPGEPSNPVVKVGPSAQDLVGVDRSHYLDLPGHSLEPGCGYEQWSRRRIADLGLTPSVYAYIATEPGRPGKLALQYWFYYAFDNFNNSHESDWEMIQLTFDADTAEQALAREPTMLSYAQHSGGENAGWDDDNVQMEDGRLLAYPAEGSHATYYEDAVWLAWGENGSGFGCDQAQEPLTAVRLEAIVVPQVIDPEGPFAWALFQGRWGEYHPWQFNAPLSPNVSHRWMEPISWTDDLRLASYPVPHTRTFGVGPSEFFCSLSTIGGNVAKQVQVAPQLILGIAGLAIAGLLLTTILTGRFLGEAIRLFRANWPTFLLSSVIVLIVGAFTTWLRDFVHHTVLVRWVNAGADREASFASLLNNGGIGFLLQFMLAGLVAPGVIAATVEIMTRDRTSYRRSVRRSWRKIPTVLATLLYNNAIVLLMSLTVVLIPLAVYRQVQWAYAPHAVVIDGAGVQSSRNVSSNTIKGDWLRTLGMAVLVTLVAGIPGPVIGMVLILLHAVPLDVAGYISSLVFAIVYPITIIASTRYYLWRREWQAERLASGLAVESWDAVVWHRLRQAVRREPGHMHAAARAREAQL